MADYLQRWPEPVDGAEVLYSIEAMLRRYLSMPEGSPELTTLWTMFTWCIDAIALPLLLGRCDASTGRQDGAGG